MAQKNSKMNTATSKQSKATVVNKTKQVPNLTQDAAADSKEAKTQEKYVSKSISSNHPSTRLIENFIVIWLDSNMNETNDDYRNSLTSLRHIVNTIKTFTNTNSCIDFLIQIKDEKVFMIVSGALAQTTVPHMQPMSKIDSIYIFCGNKAKYELWAKEWIKVKGVFTQIEPICDSLKRDTQQCDNNLTPISILAATDSSNRDLNELDQSFMYSQLLKEILLELKYEIGLKTELVDFCRIHYRGNIGELKIIDEFEEQYEHHSPIWWYTRECFTYSMLNKALRTQDIAIIIKMGFFVRDIHRQIEQLHSASGNQRPLTVYRGQGMFNGEFEKMSRSKGSLVSFNNFLSTSVDRQVSLLFARMAQNNPDLTAILFRMNIDPALTSSPFAQLNNISYYSDSEKEILFSMHTVFRIGEIEQIENGLWQVELTLTSDNDGQLKRLTERIKTEIGAGTGWHRLSQLMIKMGEFDKAKEISQTLLDSASDNDARTIASCHHQLGYVNDEKGDLTSALFHYRQSLDISLTYLPPDDPSLASTYSNIGSIYKKQGDDNAALEHFQRALSIDLHVSHPDQLQIATHYNNIGMVLKRQDKYDEALKNYEHALEIKLAHLPPRHPSLATAYSNISGIYQSRKDYSKALSFLEKTLEIKQKSLPPNHPSLIVTHRNMATAFDGLHRYEEAVQHAQHAVEIARRAFDTDHSEVKENQEYLDELRQKL
jgi:tetratricopeptide (TPR) repeat protein